MRTRYTGFNDYGMDDHESKEIKELCQKAEGSDLVLLLMACQDSYEYAAFEMFLSLKLNISFDRLVNDFAHEICISKEDFYGHRRKSMYLFKEKLMNHSEELMQKWKNNGDLRRYLGLEDAAEEIQTSNEYMKTIATRANALVRLGNLYRVDMGALYDYIDRECTVR